MLCKSAIGFNKRYNSHMPECKAAMSRHTVCMFHINGVCMVLENETINGGKLTGLKQAMIKEDSKNLEPLANDKMGPIFKMCAKRREIMQTAQQVLKKGTSKR